MIRIFLLILRKRWFLFLLLLVLPFLMNIFLWNEASQFIRMQSTFSVMKSEIEKGSYESYYFPVSAENGLVETKTEEQKEAFATYLVDSLVENPSGMEIYTDKNAYFRGGELRFPNSDDIWSSMVSLGDEEILNNLLFRKVDVSYLNKLSEKSEELGYPVVFRPVKGVYQSEVAYYQNNLIFGLGVAVLLGSFGLLVAYWLTSNIIKICQSDIYLLRFLGLSKKQVTNGISGIIYTPLLVGFALFIPLPIMMGAGYIWQDSFYILLLDSIFVLLVVLVSRKLVRGLLNA